MKRIFNLILVLLISAIPLRSQPQGPPGKPKSASMDAIQYVSANGNDADDGLIPARAKLTVYAALRALPGGKSSNAGSGTVLISGSVDYGGPAANQGFWIMGPNDPNYARPPSGWLKVSGPIVIDCLGKNAQAAHGHDVNCVINGGGTADNVHPAVWISAVSQNIAIKNIRFSNFLNIYIKYGIDSNNNRSGGLGGSSGFSMDNVTWNHGACRAGGGPGMDIGTQSFWIWLKDIVASGCVKQIFAVAARAGASRASNVVTIHTTTANNTAVGETVTIQNVLDDSFNGSFKITSVPDNQHFTYSQVGPNATSGSGQVVTASAAAINIDPGSGSGSGLIFIENINLNNGGIRFSPGNNGGGMYVRNVSYEGDFADPDMPPVLVTNVVSGSTLIRVDNLEISDPFNPVYGVQVDNGADNSSVLVTHITGGLRGPMLVLGSSGVYSNAVSPLRSGLAGFFNGRLVAGGIDAGRRLFSPAAIPFPNIATTNPASWVYAGGGGVITSGVLSPDGNTGAGRVTSSSGQSFARFYAADNVSVNIGDTYIFGVWARSQTANGYSTNSPPLRFSLNANGWGRDDTCAPFTGGVARSYGSILFPLVSPNDGEWDWFAGICKIYTNPTDAGLLLTGIVDVAHTAEFFNPVLIKIPARTKSDNEVFEITNNLVAVSNVALAGDVATLPGQRLNVASNMIVGGTMQSSGTTFANLGTPENGTFVYCSDCTISNPCAGKGTGAFAKRLNGVWVCN